MIQLSVLGSLDLRGPDGHEIRSILVQPKRLALLLYLVVAAPRGFHQRDKLCALFWPELDAAHARNALSQALHVLRRGLGSGVLVSRGNEEVGVALGTLACDALAFETAVDEERLAAAMELYRGDLLEGFFASGAAPVFDRWLDEERAQLKKSALGACRLLAAAAESAGNPDLALEWVRRAAQHAPHEEDLIRWEIALLEGDGEAAGALQAYEEFARRMQSDLELEPSAGLQALAAEIRSRQRQDPAAPPLPQQRLAPRTNALPAAAPHRFRRPLLLVLAVAVTLLLGGGGAWWLMPAESTMPADTSSSTSPPGQPYIAVLPFKNLTANPELEFFSDGLAEELITRLGQVPGLLVAPRTSSFALESHTSPLDSLVRQLGLTHFVAAGVRREGNRIRISVQLINATAGIQQWSRTYDRELSGVLQVQDEIAQAITQALRLELAPGVSALLAESTDIHAYDLYLHGLAELTNRDMNKAIALFEEAVERDPELARAHAALGYAYSLRPVYDRSVKPIDSRNAGVAAVARALALDPGEADAHLASGVLRIHFDWDFAEGERDLLRAIELNPSLSDAYRWLGQLYAYTGRKDEAVAAIYRAAELDPLSERMVCNVPRILAHVKRPEDAVREVTRDICQPDRGWTAYILIMSGMYEDALEILPPDHPGQGPEYDRYRDSEHAVAIGRGILEDVVAGVRPRTERLRLEEQKQNTSNYIFSRWYALAGDADNAMRVIETLYAERHPELLWVTGPEYARLIPDPRYRALLTKIGLPVNH